MNTETKRPHPFGDLIGYEMDYKEAGKCSGSVAFKKELLNPNDVIHGGVIYSLVDNCMGGALSSVLVDGELCATIEIKIMYLRPAGHADLVCHSHVIKKGRRVSILESEVFSDGELIAKASGSFAVF